MLLPVLGLIVVALCGLFLFGLATARVGPLAVTIGVLAALVPVAGVVAGFLWVDRWEPEPAKFLLLAFAWGACIATITALLINTTAEAVGDELLGKGSGNTVAALISAPVVEEAAKALFVVLMLWRRSEEFDGVVDGVVYAGFSAAGFAFTENIYYFGRAFYDYGFGDGHSQGVITAFFLRGVLAPFTHPLFAVLTGIGIGIAARTTDEGAEGPRADRRLPGRRLPARAVEQRRAARRVEVPHRLLPDHAAAVPRRGLPGRPATTAGAADHRHRAAAHGRARWIAPSEVDLLASLPGRRAWRRQAKRQSGKRAAKRRRRVPGERDRARVPGPAGDHAPTPTGSASRSCCAR